MTTPDTAAIRARLQAATWQPIGDETPRNVQSAPGDNGRRPVLVTRWPITGAYKPVCVACLTVDGIWLGGRRRKLWFEPTHWRPLPEDPGEDAPSAALLAAYDARGEEIEHKDAEIAQIEKERDDALDHRRRMEDALKAAEAQITALTAAAEGARAGAFATDADVRRVAQAICLAGRDPPDPPDTPCDWEWWLNEAMAALKEMGFTIVDGALAAPATGEKNG